MTKEETKAYNYFYIIEDRKYGVKISEVLDSSLWEDYIICVGTLVKGCPQPRKCANRLGRTHALMSDYINKTK